MKFKLVVGMFLVSLLMAGCATTSRHDLRMMAKENNVDGVRSAIKNNPEKFNFNQAVIDGAWECKPAVTRMGLENGGDPDSWTPASDNSRLSVLWIASSGGCLSVVELLSSRGADINFVNGGRTPLDIAMTKGHTSVVNFLSTRGAKRKASDAEIAEGAKNWRQYQEQVAKLEAQFDKEKARNAEIAQQQAALVNQFVMGQMLTQQSSQLHQQRESQQRQQTAQAPTQKRESSPVGGLSSKRSENATRCLSLRGTQIYNSCNVAVVAYWCSTSRESAYYCYNSQGQFHSAASLKLNPGDSYPANAKDGKVHYVACTNDGYPRNWDGPISIPECH